MTNLFLKKIRNSRGYVSIETLIVAGLIISFGVFIVSKFVRSGKSIYNSTNNQLEKTEKIQDGFWLLMI